MKTLIRNVVPRAGTWIETGINIKINEVAVIVVPRAGTWIETCLRTHSVCSCPVVPRAGTWIETPLRSAGAFPELSFPVRERGLKPHLIPELLQRPVGRSPCGNVD